MKLPPELEKKIREASAAAIAQFQAASEETRDKSPIFSAWIQYVSDALYGDLYGRCEQDIKEHVAKMTLETVNRLLQI